MSNINNFGIFDLRLASPRIINCIRTATASWRYFSDVFRQELTVQTFCDLQVNLPYNVHIKPLDVHKYHNCDLLKIEVTGANSVKHVQDGSTIKIFGPNQDHDANTTCTIDAPVKANLNVEALGDIRTGVFGGSKLILKSLKGSIFVDKYQGDTIDLNTDSGDIDLQGAVVASTIKVVVTKNGSIKTKRLQGLVAELNTNKGNISVESSYCDNSIFRANFGTLDLQNVHKNSKIFVTSGNLKLTGLDGQLEADLRDTTADIQISRILDDSKIVMCQNGDLQLRLSDECQLNTLFEIVTKQHVLDPSVRLIPSQNDTTLYLTPTGENYKQVRVECENGKVHVCSASWINMLKLKATK
ncbi:hypothetical protein MTP99_004996 [Tenebrio molitor]|nr:hypothetical protein MTP99_004996 [Tenebrio molitor]